MAKGRGRKRKLAVSEDSSSQSQESLGQIEECPPQAKYVPRFRSAFKKAKLDLNQTCSTQVQEDSCTQPQEDLTRTISKEPISATQPVYMCQKTSVQDCATVNKNCCCFLLIPPLQVLASPLSGGDSPQPSDSIIPGLILSEAEAKTVTQPPTPLASPTTKDGDSAPTTDPNLLIDARPKERMNLELLNPFSDEENLSAVDSIEPTTVNDYSLNEKAPVEIKPLINEGEPLLVCEPNEDATIPTTQDLPQNSANTDSLYNNHQDDEKTNKDNVTDDEDTFEGGVICDEGGEDARVVKEMMELRAEDIESQFAFNSPDVAIVPSTSPATEV